MNKFELQFHQSFRRQEKSRLLKLVYKKFQSFKKGLLFVLDNIDDISKDYSNDIVNLLTNIVNDSSNSIKIIFSSSVFLSQLENYKIKKLRGLSQKDSVELFYKKIPLQNEDLETFLNWDKVMELHQYTIDKLGQDSVHAKPCSKKIRGHIHSSECIKEYLS